MKERSFLSKKLIITFLTLIVTFSVFISWNVYATELNVDTGWEKSCISKRHITLNPKESLKKQFNSTNTIYEIKDVINLNGQTITIPEGCIIRFDGGCFTGGTIVGNLTQIQSDAANIFSTSLYLRGTWDINRIDVRWFGAVGDNTPSSRMEKDDSKAINHALIQSQCISQWNQAVPVYLAPATYKIGAPINVIYGTQLIGDSPRNSLSMPSVRLLRYGKAKGNDNDDCAINIADQSVIKNIAIGIAEKGNVLNGINVSGTSDMVLENLSIVNSHYGINKTFDKRGSGLTGTQMTNIKISNCVRGVSVSDYGSLPRRKKDLITWMNHVYFSKIVINNVYECGLYFDIISLFDNNIVDGISIAKVGNEDFYPGNYFKDFSGKYITGVYASIYDDNSIGLLAIQKGYLENIYCTNKMAGKPVKGKYLLDSYNYDKNPCICVNNVNLVVRDSHFQNDLVLVTSLGRDNILIESCTDGEFYRGQNDKKRFYLCCENPKTSLWIRCFNVNNTSPKDCIKNNILSRGITSLKLQNISFGSGSYLFDDVDISIINNSFVSNNTTIYVSDRASGSGIWRTFPMATNAIPDIIKFKGNLDFSLNNNIVDKGFKTIKAKEIVNSEKYK